MTTAKDLGRFAREIVAKRVALTQVVGQGLALLVLAHVLSVHQDTTITNAVAGFISMLATVVGILWSRDGTTVADPALVPMSVNGEPMAPIPQLAATVPPAPPTP